MTTGFTGFGQQYAYITGLARAFSEQIPTVYVNPAIGWYQAWVKREPTGVLSFFSSDRLKVLQPYTFLSYGNNLNRYLNMRCVARQLSSHVEGRLLFWMEASPENLEIARPFPHHVIAYSTGNAGEAGDSYQYETLEDVDYILALSLPTFETARSYFPDKAYYIPCGIDCRLYRDYRAWRQQGGTPITAQIVERTRYRHQVLYLGTVNDRIDFGLMYYLGRRFPQCQFVVAGPIRVGRKRPHLERCRELPNLRFIGGLEPFDYIYLIEQSDACIVPYELNEFNLHANPLKLCEYWMFAKPVVSTYIPTYRLYGDLLYMAEDFTSFAENLRVAIHEPDDRQRSERRLAVASAHDVRELAEAILAIVSEDSTQSPDFYLQRIRQAMA